MKRKKKVKAPPVPATASQLLERINKARGENGLPLLKVNDKLNLAAQMKLNEMRDQNYFAHENPTTGKRGHEWIKVVGVPYSTAAENLGQGFGGDANALTKAWLESPSHRANVLNPRFQETGIAIGDYKGTPYIVQMFSGLDK